jgi:hypothetical protein
MSRRLVAAIGTILTLGTAGLSVCSGSPPSAGASPVAAPSVVTPLATSIATTAGTWATVPMGRLDQAPNTFWQLLFLPTGTSSWSDEVGATAVATNGGLVLAAGSRGIVVGVRPSNRLTFSPLIASSDAGRTWSNGLLSEGLAEHPQALAVDDTGQAVALVAVRGEGLTRVLLSAAGLSRWQTLATASSLAAVQGAKACGLGEITAVSLLAGSPLVGTSCARPGVVGILARRTGKWELIGPPLPSSLDRGRAEVLAMTTAANTLTVLVAVSIGAADDLVAAWSADGGQYWRTSTALPVSEGLQLASVGPVSGDGLFVLMNRRAGADELDTVEGPGVPWTSLPSPPAGTATVAFPPGTTPEALVVHDAALTVLDLTSASRTWVQSQMLSVPIQYGSSS